MVEEDWVGSLSGRKGKKEGGKVGRDILHYGLEKGGGRYVPGCTVLHIKECFSDCPGHNLLDVDKPHLHLG